MVQSTLGERLQQARQQLGWSLEEVSGKLNISKEILGGFEANEFSVQLPEIYARGFFIAYVKLLHLNISAFLAEYEILTGTTKKRGFPSLGHLQIETGEETVQDTKVVPETQTKPPKGLKLYVRTLSRNKRLLYGVIACVAVLLLFGCWSHKKRSSVNTEAIPTVVNEVEIIPALTEESATLVTRTEPSGVLPQETDVGISAPRPQSAMTEEPSTTVARVTSGTETDISAGIKASESITLVALEDVQIFVRTEADKKRVFFGTLKAGERQLISKETSLQISFSEGGYLVIERSDGTLIRPQTSGRGWIRIP